MNEIKIYKGEDGFWVAEFEGGATQGKTLKELFANTLEVVDLLEEERVN